MIANQLHLSQDQDSYSITENAIPLNFPELSILLQEKIRTNSSFEVLLIPHRKAFIRYYFAFSKRIIHPDLEFIYSELFKPFLRGRSSSYFKREMLECLFDFCRKNGVTIVRLLHENRRKHHFNDDEIRLFLSYEHSIGDMSRKLLRIQGYKVIIADNLMPKMRKREVNRVISSQKNQLMLWI